jgi:hypothetical protein
MESIFLNLPYTTEHIEVHELQIDKAIDFYRTIEKGNYCNPIHCERMKNGDELVYFDIHPEIGQKPLVDIRYIERIAVQFDKSDSITPWVFALREDFPLVMHLNAMGFEKPRCLCLYEKPYSDLKYSWTSISFLERIREWLTLTSEENLHQHDQPLEPFFINNFGSIIIPHNYTSGDQLFINRGLSFNDKIFLHTTLDQNASNNDTNFLILQIESKPTLHGFIRTSPVTFSDLFTLLCDLGIDFVQNNLKPFLDEFNLNIQSEFLEHKLIILLYIPKMRYDGDLDYTYELCAFVVNSGIKDIAIASRILVEEGGLLAPPFPAEPFNSQDASKILVGNLNTYFTLNKSAASIFSGLANDNIKIGLIGAGALGSQIFSILTRMGYGIWKILDDDVLLPHNLVRHDLGPLHVGSSKAQMLSFSGNRLLDDFEHSAGLHENYLKPRNSKDIIEFFADVDLIIDASASIPVSRKLSDDDNLKSRRISAFMNPNGTDLVMLIEPRDRSIKLAHLEMQYYRLIWRSEGLCGHLLINGESVRFSTSCRDLTSTIKQFDVVSLAGTCAKMITKVINEDKGQISVWVGDDSGSLSRITIPASPIFIHNSDKWSVVFDEYTLSLLRKARSTKLPNETGGVLIGAVDQLTNTVYVVDSILSPPDSKEYPYSYYRGIDGLEDELLKLSACTANNLYYIGEWHSHPDNCSVNRSDDDMILFNWIADHLGGIGLPPLMVIVGDKDLLGIYVN